MSQNLEIKFKSTFTIGSKKCYPLVTVLLVSFTLFASTNVTCDETKVNFNLADCSLQINQTFYNISSLVRRDGSPPWQLNKDSHLPSKQSFTSTQEVFINLCRPLPKSLPLFPFGGCGNGNGSSLNNDSSVCLIDFQTNETASWGRYDTMLVTYDPVQEAIHFNLRDNNITTHLFLHCSPSVTNIRPILISRAKEGEVNTIEWYHAAACPREEIVGQNCQVDVPNIGESFDLSPLRKETHYDFPEENGYHYYINICGPINRGPECGNQSGICHINTKTPQHTYSLGKWSSELIYSDGELKLVYKDGSPYRDSASTPRKTIIKFICNTTAGEGKPDFVAETNQTYIIHWETKYACPKVIHSVNCVWKNSTHKIDLTPLRRTSEGNHIEPIDKYVLILNVCGPINRNMRGMKPSCQPSSGICITDVTNHKTYNLGQPKNPPVMLFDDKISLLYTDGDVCPGGGDGGNSSRYISRITFVCDQRAGLGAPILIDGNPEKCTWLFEWKTSLVCKARPIYAHQCIFEDDMTGLKVDITRIFSSLQPISHQNDSHIRDFFINVCSDNQIGSHREMELSKRCVNSSVCMAERSILEENSTYLSLGDLQSSQYTFQGQSLHLQFFNGSSCGNTSTWSSEIEVKCTSRRDTRYVGYELGECSSTLFLESPEVCSLVPPSCTYRVNNSLFDLRELSSISHAWRVDDSKNNGKIYYFNICNKIPDRETGSDGRSSVVECEITDGGEEVCRRSLGLENTMTISYEDGDNVAAVDSSQRGKNLVITYKNPESKVCSSKTAVTTKITLVCDHSGRKPIFVRKVDSPSICEYQFRWETYLACSSSQSERKEWPLEHQDYYYFDQRPELRLDAVIDMTAVFNRTFSIKSNQYEYLFDLGGHADNKSGNCQDAALCQRKIDGSFERNIGSIGTESIVIQGNQFKMKLISTNHQKCGKNSRKNVTSAIFFQCSEEKGVGKPDFFYESNDCDYIFLWETDLVCPKNLIPREELREKLKAKDPKEDFYDDDASSSPASLFAALLIILGIIVCAIIPLSWLVLRLSDREKRLYLVHWIRNRFRASVITSIHYSQVSSDSTKLVSINDDL